jgi:hypothetical protein
VQHSTVWQLSLPILPVQNQQCRDVLAFDPRIWMDCNLHLLIIGGYWRYDTFLQIVLSPYLFEAASHCQFDKTNVLPALPAAVAQLTDVCFQFLDKKPKSFLILHLQSRLLAEIEIKTQPFPICPMPVGGYGLSNQ